MIYPSLYIEYSTPMGRGIFTREPISAGTLVEESPVIVMGAEERALLDKTRLHDYIFEWGEVGTDNKQARQCCMALGYIAVYNHSYRSNCEYEMDIPAMLIRIRTVHYIGAGEQLFINYNGDWNNEKPLWFDAK